MMSVGFSRVGQAGGSASRRPSAWFSALSDALAVFNAACRVAGAVDAKRQPDPADLRKLGITGPLRLPS